MIIWKNFKTLQKYVDYSYIFPNLNPPKNHVFYIKNIKNYNIKPNDFIEYNGVKFKIIDICTKPISNLISLHCTIEN